MSHVNTIAAVHRERANSDRRGSRDSVQQRPFRPSTDSTGWTAVNGTVMRSSFDTNPRPSVTGSATKRNWGRVYAHKAKDHFDLLFPPSLPLRKRINYFLNATGVGIYMDLFQISLSLIASALYVVETYEKDTSNTSSTDIFGTLELILTCFFLMDYLLKLYLAPHRLKYMLGFFAIIDAVTIVPVFVNVALSGEDVQDSSVEGEDDPDTAILNFLSFLRFLRALRILRLWRVISLSVSGVQRSTFKLVFTIISLIFCTAGFIQFIEGLGDLQLTFHDSLYLMVVTITTVGYGDISPQTTLGRMAMMVIISMSVIMVPLQTSSLINEIDMQSKFLVSYKRPRGQVHVLVIGDVLHRSLRDFLEEFFDYERGKEAQVLMMAPFEPSEELAKLLTEPLYYTRVKYIKGSPLVAGDLERAKTKDADACFVLASKETLTLPEAEEKDSSTILQVLAVKHYKPEMPVYSQVLVSKSKMHLDLTKCEHPLYIDKMKANILGRSTRCHGLVSFVFNFLRTGSVIMDELEEWEEQYASGAGKCLYKVVLSDAFIGLTYAEASVDLLASFSATLVAIKVNNSIIVNPGRDVRVSQKTKTCYVLCGGKDVVHAIEGYNPTEEEVGVANRRRSSAQRMSNVSFSETDSVNSSAITHQSTPDKAGVLHAIDDDSTGFRAQLNNKWHTPPRPKLRWPRYTSGNITKVLSPLRRSERPKSIANLRVSDVQIDKLEESDDGDMSFEDNVRRVCNPPSDMSGHVVLCGMPKSIADFLGPLRANHWETIAPIVVLHPEVPGEDTISAISRFQEAYYVEGSGKDGDDLRYVDAHRARCIIYLNTREKSSVGGHEEQKGDGTDDAEARSLMSDADAVIMTMAANARSPHTSTVTELLFRPNVRILNEKSLEWVCSETDRQSYQYRNEFFSPAFAAGRAFPTPLFMNLLTCQMYYNADIVTILERLIAGSVAPDIEVYTELGIDQSHLFQTELPNAFVEKTWGELFEFLVNVRNILPLGLYRAAAAFGNPLPFVYTAPEYSDRLHPGDYVFLLSPSQPTFDL